MLCMITIRIAIMVCVLVRRLQSITGFPLAQCIRRQSTLGLGDMLDELELGDKLMVNKEEGPSTYVYNPVWVDK